MIELSPEEIACAERAAELWGMQKRQGRSADDVVRELVPDERYVSCRFARDRYSRIMEHAAKVATKAGRVPLCPQCQGIVANPRNRYCSRSCARMGSGHRPKRQKIEVSDADRRGMVDLYEGGESVRVLSHVFGYGAKVVDRVLKEEGVTKRASHLRRPKVCHTCGKELEHNQSQRYCSARCRKRRGECVDCGHTIKTDSERCRACAPAYRKAQRAAA